MVHLIRSRATKHQLDEMVETLGAYVKLAVDTRLGILAGGGVLHADCEAVLLDEGSHQENIWGADWIPETQQIRYVALINIQPRQNNPTMDILDPALRDRVSNIV